VSIQHLIVPVPIDPMDAIIAQLREDCLRYTFTQAETARILQLCDGYEALRKDAAAVSWSRG
jgi:hypothetical protein